MDCEKGAHFDVSVESPSRHHNAEKSTHLVTNSQNTESLRGLKEVIKSNQLKSLQSFPNDE